MSLLSSMARSLPSVEVWNWLGSDLKNVVTGLLKNHCVESATDGTQDLCGPLARRAWIPPEHGQAILVVHEVTDRDGEGKGRLGSTKTCHGELDPRKRCVVLSLGVS